MNFVITGLNEKYWQLWGVSWVASLQEIAQTKAKPIIFNLGLSHHVVEYLKSINISVLDCQDKGDFRQSIIDSMVALSEEIKGNYLYFDADIWFQKNFDEVFDFLEDKVLFSENHNSGVIAAHSRAFDDYRIIRTICHATKENRAIYVAEQYFPKYFGTLSNVYNCVDLANLVDKEGVLTHKNLPVSAIHIVNVYKSLAMRHNLQFSERYPELYNKYLQAFQTYSPKRFKLGPPDLKK